MNQAEGFNPIFILGAGRSGTNVLRDVMTNLPGFATWPCDEIQPIWRHGNINWPNDELTITHARPAVKTFIQKQFHKQWRRLGKPTYLVEKTCANTLRVPFVDAIFPNAKYIQILRHGADVVKSAEKRWAGELEVPPLSYFFAKARFIPPLDLPVYFWSFVSKRIGLLVGNAKQLSTWGPRFSGMNELSDQSLPEICARQWCACVTATNNSFETIAQKRRITVYYEELIQNPVREIKQILEFLDVHLCDDQLETATGIVRVKQMEKYQHAQYDPYIKDILRPCLSTAGYEEKI